MEFSNKEEEEKFFKENIKLVNYTIKKFFPEFLSDSRKEFYEDVFQDGCIGLVKAYRNFNNDYGIKFSTYAIKIIVNEILMRKNQYLNSCMIFKRSFISKIKMMFKEIKKENLMLYTKEDCLKYNIDYNDFLIYANNCSSNNNELIIDDNNDDNLELINFIKDIKNDTEDNAISSILLEDFIKKINSKGNKHIDVFNLYFINNLTENEVSKKLNISRFTVHKKINYIRNVFKEIFNGGDKF